MDLNPKTKHPDVEIKNIYATIFERASTRKFEAAPIPNELPEQIDSFVSKIYPLLPEIEITHKIVNADAVKGLMLPKAPHFILISGKDSPMRDACAGFIYQHVVLYLHSIGMAARWLSSAKAKASDPDHIIGIAFGKPLKPATRKTEEFDRKPLDEISSGANPLLEAVRLAPSGMNGQPWYFIVDDGIVHVFYKERLGGLIGKLYNQTGVDLGIALCHLAVASRYHGQPFTFVTGLRNTPAAPKGFTYAGSVINKK